MVGVLWRWLMGRPHGSMDQVQITKSQLGVLLPVTAITELRVEAEAAAELLRLVSPQTLPESDAQTVQSLLQVAAAVSGSLDQHVAPRAGRSYSVGVSVLQRPVRRPVEPKRSASFATGTRTNPKPRPLSSQASAARAPKPVPDRRRVAVMVDRPPSPSRAVAGFRDTALSADALTAQRSLAA